MSVDDVEDKLTNQAERVGDRVSHAVEGLRDRTADVVRADGGSIYREVGKLGRRVDDVEGSLTDRLAQTEDVLGDQLGSVQATLSERIDDLIATGKRTTLPRKLFWLLLGAAIGVGAAYLGDPDRGRARRAQLQDQAVARTREVSEQVGNQAKMAVDRAKGEVIESAKDAMPEDIPEDPKLLEARVKSDVFGKRDDVQDVVLRVDAPGVVALKGTVPTADSVRELLAEVAEVEGVIDVVSELAVREV